jgi:hypothetical protein
MNERDQVLKAAADLVAAFARNDREACFGAFSADALFPETATVFGPNDSRSKGTDSLGKPALRQAA